MIRRSVIAGVAAALIGVPAAAQSLDEVIAGYLKARGGLDKIKAAQTIRITGKMTVGPGLEAPFTLETKRPKSMRLEFTFSGMVGIQAFDGTTAWMVMPFTGKKDPEAMSPEDTKEFEEGADFDGELVDWKAKGHTVELLGKESVEGADAWKLKLTKKSGSVTYVYLEADSFLEIRSESKRKMRGSEVESETSYGEYKEVAGLMMPHAMESGPKGGPQRQKMTAEKIEVNVPIDDARFRMPEAKRETPPPPKQ
jgi:hypothetical protein